MKSQVPVDIVVTRKLRINPLLNRQMSQMIVKVDGLRGQKTKKTDIGDGIATGTGNVIVSATGRGTESPAEVIANVTEKSTGIGIGTETETRTRIRIGSRTKIVVVIKTLTGNESVDENAPSPGRTVSTHGAMQDEHAVKSLRTLQTVVVPVTKRRRELRRSSHRPMELLPKARQQKRKTRILLSVRRAIESDC